MLIYNNYQTENCLGNCFMKMYLFVKRGLTKFRFIPKACLKFYILILIAINPTQYNKLTIWNCFMYENDWFFIELLKSAFNQYVHDNRKSTFI